MFKGTGTEAPGAVATQGRWTPDDAVVVLVELQPEIVVGSRTNVETKLQQAVSMLVEGTAALGIPIFRSSSLLRLASLSKS